MAGEYMNEKIAAVCFGVICAALTGAQATPPSPIQQALNALQYDGVAVPPGWTVRVTASTSQGKGGQYSPNKKLIEISPAEIAAVRPSLDVSAANKPGVLVTVHDPNELQSEEPEPVAATG
jgi:hypothetical protein